MNVENELKKYIENQSVSSNMDERVIEMHYLIHKAYKEIQKFHKIENAWIAIEEGKEGTPDDFYGIVQDILSGEDE